MEDKNNKRKKSYIMKARILLLIFFGVIALILVKVGFNWASLILIVLFTLFFIIAIATWENEGNKLKANRYLAEKYDNEHKK